MAYRLFVWLHRWTGLTLAAFLILVGLTGSLLAFRTKLEHAINPQLFATSRPGQAVLDLATIAERAEAQAPHSRPEYVSVLTDRVEITCVPRRDPGTGKLYALDFNHLILDPYTGRELGRRRDGDLTQGRINVMPFLYNLHSALAMGATGEWVLGVAALIWTLDCFVGFYLTLPRSRGPFWRRWRLAWMVKRRASAFRINFDLHRAGGLWSWALLLIFAWSSVMLALRPVYDRVTGALFDYQAQAMPAHMVEEPRVNWREALTAGERFMGEKARRYGFTITRPYGIAYLQEYGAYQYAVRCSRDIRSTGWDGSVWVDGNTGAFRGVLLPSGQHTGNTLSTWLWALHFGDVRDSLPYRVVVSVVGLIIAMLAVTGVYIWWKKRRARAALRF